MIAKIIIIEKLERSPLKVAYCLPCWLCIHTLYNQRTVLSPSCAGHIPITHVRARLDHMMIVFKITLSSCTNQCESVQICMNLWEYIGIVVNLYQFVWICSNLYESVRFWMNLYVIYCSECAGQHLPLPPAAACYVARDHAKPDIWIHTQGKQGEHTITRGHENVKKLILSR